MQKLLFFFAKLVIGCTGCTGSQNVKEFRYEEKNSGFGDEFSKWEEKGRQQQRQFGKM